MKAAPIAGLRHAAMLYAAAIFGMAASGPSLAEVSRVVVKE